MVEGRTPLAFASLRFWVFEVTHLELLGVLFLPNDQLRVETMHCTCTFSRIPEARIHRYYHETYVRAIKTERNQAMQTDSNNKQHCHQ